MASLFSSPPLYGKTFTEAQHTSEIPPCAVRYLRGTLHSPPHRLTLSRVLWNM